MMNSIIDAALRYNRAVLLTLILLLGAGGLTYNQLPKEATPDIKLPFLYVSASLKGISPEDSLDQLLEPLESEIQGLEGLKSMDSTAYQGGANLTLEFEAGWDVERAKDDVQEAVDAAKQNLPGEADDPNVTEITISEANLVLNISGELPERELNRIADELKDAIEDINTVLEVELTGNRDEVVEVIIDLQTLDSFNININSLLQIINGQNTLVNAGQLEGTSGSFPVKLPGTFESIDDVLATPVLTEGTAAITLGDIAQIRRTFNDAQSFARINGAPTLSLAVNKRSGENLIQTVDRVKAVVNEQLAALDPQIADRVDVTYSYDESTSVRQLLGDLINNTAFAILLVMIVVLGILGLRSAFLVAVAIPGSFMIGFLVLSAMGLSLNIVVLFSLILASGMLVDGAVVVTEYADRRLAEGYSPREAYGMAAKQMSWPIIASTATTLAAFGPMIFFPGIIGEFMKFLPITLFITLSASLFMALLFVPTLGANLNRFLRTIMVFLAAPIAFVVTSAVFGIVTGMDVPAIMASAEETGSPVLMAAFLGSTAVLAILVAFFAAPLLIALIGKPQVVTTPEEAMDIRTIGGAAGAYANLLRQLLKAPIFMIALTVAVLASLFMLYMSEDRGSEFFPEVEAEFANLIIHSRGDFSLEENDALVSEVERRVLEVQQRNGEFYSAQADVNSTSTNGSDTIGTISLVFTDWFLRDRRVPEIMAELREVASDLPGIQIEIQTVAGGPPAGKALQLELSGTSLSDLENDVDRILSYMKSLPELTDVEDSRPAPGMEIVIKVDREAATRVGADYNLIGSYVRLITTGIDITTYRPADSDDELDIKLRLPTEDRHRSQLDAIRVDTPVGPVPLSSLIDLRYQPRTSIITKKDGELSLNIQANIAETADTNATLMTKQITEWLGANPTAPSVDWKFGGEQQDQAEAFAFLGQAMGAAVFIMFLILLVQFNSFYQTLLILTAVVMSVFGVFLGLIVTDKPFGVFTFIGVVSLAGIVVNNNIVLIDTYNTLRRQLMPKSREDYMNVILLTAAQRLRPVMITTVTTILGLIPMSLGIGVDFTNFIISVDAPSAQWWTGLSQAIAFGLTVATMLTLFFTPSALMFRALFQSEEGFFGRGAKSAEVVASLPTSGGGDVTVGTDGDDGIAEDDTAATPAQLFEAASKNQPTTSQ